MPATRADCVSNPATLQERWLDFHRASDGGDTEAVAEYQRLMAELQIMDALVDYMAVSGTGMHVSAATCAPWPCHAAKGH
jgi:hypothetical protein